MPNKRKSPRISQCTKKSGKSDKNPKKLKRKEPKLRNQEHIERIQVELDENIQLEESIPHLERRVEFIKDEPLDIKEETVPMFELVQNYTNEYFLVPLSEKNEQLDQKLDVVKLEKSESVNCINKVKKENIKKESKGRNRKIYRPPTESEIIEMQEFINNRNKGINKTEQVVCNEDFYTVDIFTIFGKSIADQLRSFPVDKAVSLQNKIQDLITEERLTFFRDDSYFRLDPSYKLCEK